MAEDIQVAMATDRNYLDYALVAAASLLAQHPGGGITLHLLHEELDESDFARFEELRRIDGFRLVPRKIERGFFQGWPELRWSTSAYYRLILPSLLPDLEKILYLDCDLLVLDDIAELWETGLDGRSCAAAAVRVAPEHQKKIGLPAEAVYFNSGVMLFNLRKMAHENHEKRFIRLFDELGGRIKYPDQDILNLAYWNDYVKRDLRLPQPSDSGALFRSGGRGGAAPSRHRPLHRHAQAVAARQDHASPLRPIFPGLCGAGRASPALPAQTGAEVAADGEPETAEKSGSVGRLHPQHRHRDPQDDLTKPPMMLQ